MPTRGAILFRHHMHKDTVPSKMSRCRDSRSIEPQDIHTFSEKPCPMTNVKVEVLYSGKCLPFATQYQNPLWRDTVRSDTVWLKGNTSVVVFRRLDQLGYAYWRQFKRLIYFEPMRLWRNEEKYMMTRDWPGRTYFWKYELILSRAEDKYLRQDQGPIHAWPLDGVSIFEQNALTRDILPSKPTVLCHVLGLKRPILESLVQSNIK